MNLRHGLRGLWTFLFLLLPVTSWAFKLSPMIVSFSPSGGGATQTFLVENTGQDKIAIQIEAFHRYSDAEGKETRTPTDEFSIYPQQLALGAGEKRNVRVTWTGNRQPDRELNYRLVVTELPVDLKKPRDREAKPGANLTFLMQYVASLYVTPKDARPKVVVDSFKVLLDGNLELVLKNLGAAHQVLKGLRVFAETDEKNRTELKGDALEQLQGENILALSSRKFLLPLPQTVAKAAKSQPGSVKIEIEL